MKLLNTYDDRDEAEEAAVKLTGEKRLASERDATVVIYNLFGIPSWGNFHRLGMYNLGELKSLLDRRASWHSADKVRHAEIINGVKRIQAAIFAQIHQEMVEAKGLGIVLVDQSRAAIVLLKFLRTQNARMLDTFKQTKLELGCFF